MVKYENFVAQKLAKQAKMRLFEQLHQDDVTEVRRASGSMRCELCGLRYRQHSLDLRGLDDCGSSWAVRLCCGELVHL